MQAAIEVDKSARPQGIASAILSSAMGTESHRIAWSVRSVGFIAKPEKTDELIACLEGSVNEILQQMPGFAGSMILRSQSELRKLLALTFWTTEKHATTNCWERRRPVRQLISPTVDVCTKVQIFRADAVTYDRASESDATDIASTIG